MDPAALLHVDDLYLDDDLGQLPTKERPMQGPGLTVMTKLSSTTSHRR
jgi:hypothetical protein